MLSVSAFSPRLGRFGMLNLQFQRLERCDSCPARPARRESMREQVRSVDQKWYFFYYGPGTWRRKTRPPITSTLWMRIGGICTNISFGTGSYISSRSAAFPVGSEDWRVSEFS
jgi:hypothetical protein